MDEQRQAIEALLEERRLFPPPAEFKARARVSDESLYAEAEADPVGFWMSRALDELTWYREPTEGLDDSNPPFFKWFADGELNASVNCLDRHLAGGGGDKTAYIWIGEPGDERVISYQELHDEVNRLANVLRGFGVSGAIAWRSTSAWCPSCPWPFWPARASARRTRWSSAASRRNRSRVASTTPSARC